MINRLSDALNCIITPFIQLGRLGYRAIRLILEKIGLVAKIDQVAQEAFQYRLSEANRGDAEAQYKVGCCYEDALGTKKDSNQAFKYYQLAAKQSHAGAQYNLAICYDEGIGTQPSQFAQAFKYYQLAAKQGNVNAQCGLASLYECGLGVEMDIRKAIEYYNLAASNGVDHAANEALRLQEELNSINA